MAVGGVACVARVAGVVGMAHTDTAGMVDAIFAIPFKIRVSLEP